MGSIRKRAFTFIELLVIVGIVALLAAFTVPTYQLILSQLQLSEATSQVGDFIRLSEQKTVTEQKTYGVTLTAGGNIISQTLTTVSGTTTTVTVVSTLTLPSNIVVSSASFGSSSSVTFTTAGAPSLSGSLVLNDTVRSRNRQISVRPSGEVVAGPEY